MVGVFPGEHPLRFWEELPYKSSHQRRQAQLQKLALPVLLLAQLGKPVLNLIKRKK